MKDITPAIRWFSNASTRRAQPGRHVRDLLIAGGDDVLERVSLYAEGLEEENATLRDLLQQALAMLCEKDAALDAARNRRAA